VLPFSSMLHLVLPCSVYFIVFYVVSARSVNSDVSGCLMKLNEKQVFV